MMASDGVAILSSSAMRHALALFLAACGSGATRAPIVAPTPEPVVPELVAVAATPIAAPQTTVASALSTGDRAPPVVVLIDADGVRRVAAATTWADLGAGRLASGPTLVGGRDLARFVRDVATTGIEPRHAVDRFSASEPAPEPGESGDDDSGGVGTAMALDEAGMADATPDDRISGQRGPRPAWKRQHEPDADAAIREAVTVGEVTGGALDGVPAVVVADPAARATALIAAVEATEGAIGVMHGGVVRPLRVRFDRHRVPYPELGDWIEVRLDATGAIVETVPSAPVVVPWSDVGAGLATTLQTVRGARSYDADTPIDVLVDPTVDAQHLVDVVVALEGADARLIGLGSMPDAEQMKLRGHHDPRVSASGAIAAAGDLDKAIIRRFVKANLTPIRACYEKQLAGNPTLAGTVQVSFYITPKGSVASATASGVDAAVASCVAGVIRTIRFPRPKGGGGVQVNYPFSFRQ